MDTTNKSKWQVRAAAIVIFFLGFTAGVLALNGYRAWSRSRLDASRQDRFEQMLDRLQLSADQKTQVHQIPKQAIWNECVDHLPYGPRGRGLLVGSDGLVSAVGIE